MSKLKKDFYIPRCSYEEKYLNKTSTRTIIRRTVIYSSIIGLLTYNITKTCNTGGIQQNGNISEIERIITEHDM